LSMASPPATSLALTLMRSPLWSLFSFINI
jgi:hypothetical protein